jgi:hypothetical protein
MNASGSVCGDRKQLFSRKPRPAKALSSFRPGSIRAHHDDPRIAQRIVMLESTPIQQFEIQ